MNKRRCEYDIVASILITSKKGATRTQIMYCANLSFALLNKYLNFLISDGLLEYKKERKNGFYVTSEKGDNFLASYRRIQAICKKVVKNLVNERSGSDWVVQRFEARERDRFSE